MATLTISYTGCPNRTIELPDHAVTIGRAAENDIVLVDDLEVSRHHAALRLEGSQYVLEEDRRTLNGLSVDGRREQRIVLEPGVPVTIGQHRLLLVVEPDATLKQTSADWRAPLDAPITATIRTLTVPAEIQRLRTTWRPQLLGAAALMVGGLVLICSRIAERPVLWTDYFSDPETNELASADHALNDRKGSDLGEANGTLMLGADTGGTADAEESVRHPAFPDDQGRITTPRPSNPRDKRRVVPTPSAVATLVPTPRVPRASSAPAVIRCDPGELY